MTTPETRPRDACRHCGKSIGLTVWNLRPSRDNNRFFVCRSRGGHFDLPNGCKMMSILSGMLGMALAMTFPCQWIVKAGHASKGSIAAGIAVAGLAIGLASITAARLGLQLEARR